MGGWAPRSHVWGGCLSGPSTHLSRPQDFSSRLVSSFKLGVGGDRGRSLPPSVHRWARDWPVGQDSKGKGWVCRGWVQVWRGCLGPSGRGALYLCDLLPHKDPN